MKNIFIKFCMGLSVLFLASCLDDDKAPLDPDGSQNVIEFFDASVPSSPAGAIYPAWTTAFSVSPEATFSQTISYSGPNGNDRDITLTLAIDPVALNDFNEQMEELHSATYELLPAEWFSIPNMTVTIPAGQTRVDIPITIYPDQFDLSRNWAIPLRIASSSHGVLSAHYSVAILATVVKNKYDGVYSVVQYGDLTPFQGMYDGVNPTTYGGLYPKASIEFRTVNGNTVNYYDSEYGVQGHIFDANGGASYWGGFAAQFSFNENNVVTSVVNAYGQGNNNRSGKLDPNAAAPVPEMTFEDDGVTPKEMSIWYVMVQSGADRVFWKETYTYEGPRD